MATEQAPPDEESEPEVSGPEETAQPDEGDSEPDEPEQTKPPNNDMGCPSCATPESEMLVVYDQEFDYPWKSGNPYARICPECGARTFTSKSYWATQDVPYVILKGEDEPKPLYDCPYDGCDGELIGQPEKCPTCEQELVWEED